MTKDTYKTGDTVFTDWINGNYKFNFNTVFYLGIRTAAIVELLTKHKVKNWEQLKKLTKYTHVGKIVKVNKDSYIIAEATGKGYVFNEYKKNYIDRLVKQNYFLIKRPTHKLTNVYKEASKLEDRQYGWMSIVRIGISTLGKLVPFGKYVTYIPLVNKLIDKITDKHLICTEANAKIDYICSGKKINMSEEFNVSKDRLMPMHHKKSKYLKTIK